MDGCHSSEAKDKTLRNILEENKSKYVYNDSRINQAKIILKHLTQLDTVH